MTDGPLPAHGPEVGDRCSNRLFLASVIVKRIQFIHLASSDAHKHKFNHKKHQKSISRNSAHLSCFSRSNSGGMFIWMTARAQKHFC